MIRSHKFRDDNVYRSGAHWVLTSYHRIGDTTVLLKVKSPTSHDDAVTVALRMMPAGWNEVVHLSPCKCVFRPFDTKEGYPNYRQEDFTPLARQNRDNLLELMEFILLGPVAEPAPVEPRTMFQAEPIASAEELLRIDRVLSYDIPPLYDLKLWLKTLRDRVKVARVVDLAPLAAAMTRFQSGGGHWLGVTDAFNELKKTLET